MSKVTNIESDAANGIAKIEYETTKQIINAEVTDIRSIGKGIYKMQLFCPEATKNAKAGQFVNVYPKSKETLLPRPISISEAGADCITLVFAVVGKGTREFSAYKKGDSVQISTPLGNGFNLDRMEFKKSEKEKKNIVLFGGGVGSAPLVELAKALKTSGFVSISAVIGFREEPLLAAELETAGAQVFVALESEGQNVIDKFDEKVIGTDYAFACGPKPMLKALAARFKEKDIPLQVSMEERMGCGYGACVGCACRTADGLKKVCSDGPVFMADEVMWDE